MASAETLLLAITEQQATSLMNFEALSDDPNLFQSRVVPPIDLFRESGGEFFNERRQQRQLAVFCVAQAP